LKAVENGGWEGGVRKAVEGAAQTKVKCAHCGDTLRNPLNVDLDINNERQACKIGTVCVEEYLWEGRVNKGD
jgi:hypothetical protein